jgi:glycosyltransferase involved in cell wall biosynthesis
MPIESPEACPTGGPFVILIPLFNDWETFAKLAVKIDEVLSSCEREADILIVDDASVVDPDPRSRFGPYRAVRRIDVLRLRRNLGHQRAIAVGLTFIHEQRTPAYEAVVVMDGDGEDAPEDVPRLLERLEADGGRAIVFAERTRRSESLVFRIFYFLYRHLHFVLTSVRVRVGNFSAIPRRRLESLVAVSDLWNHYAAAAFHSRQPYCTIPTQRARRLGGRSSMNFVALVAHGLSAISVYREVIGVRLLVLAIILALAAVLGLAVTVFLRLATRLAIPGWATSATGILLVVLLQAMVLALVFCFVILGDRNSTTFLPLRDHVYFIAGTSTLYERPGANPGGRPVQVVDEPAVSDHRVGLPRS